MLLKNIGDFLDQADDAREINCIGFNSSDKNIWSIVRGDEVAMISLLLKYKRQISDRMGQEIVDHINWSKAQDTQRELQRVKSIRKVIIQEDDGKFFIRLWGERLSRDNFDIFLKECRRIGAKYNGQCNVVKIHFDIDLHRFGKKMEEIGVKFYQFNDIKKLQEKILVSKRDPDHLTKRLNTVTVELRGNKIHFSHQFCPKLNEAYKNSDKVEGAIGYCPETKSRFTFSDNIEDHDSIVSVISEVRPYWDIEYSFNYKEHFQKIKKIRNKNRETDKRVYSVLKKSFEPKPHQNEGLAYIDKFNGNCIIGDDMGLGKTLQILLWGAINKKRLLVILPKNVRTQWCEEAKKFFKNGVYTPFEIDPSIPADINLDKYNLVTVNYEIIGRYKDAFLRSGFDILAIDESHRIKNPKAQVTQNCFEIGADIPHKILATGTPLKNKKTEIFTQANLIRPGAFSSPKSLKMMTGMQVREILRGMFFRRTKKEELKDLPQKTRNNLYYHVPKCPQYEGGGIEECTRLKFYLAQIKTELTIELARDFQKNTESKTIIYSLSEVAARKIAKELGDKAVIHTGKTSHKKREAAKKAFMDEKSKIRFFVATIGSAKEGLNLTVADKIIYNDYPWTPAEQLQSEDRAFRIGQKNAVNIYNIVIENCPFDMYFLDILSEKMEIYMKYIEGKNLKNEDQWRDDIHKEIQSKLGKVNDPNLRGKGSKQEQLPIFSV